ncbi:unnamed protein product (macronuclear) [Paramecium tetraurelia]|uniref:Viral A-type inclusion protein n=1 Tax=Paramecium tetraurelia TaxID=5888 RepID=A0DA64_PARTE|nr:uncharacterized protein GSPATT00014838001 [Paramecium tetraurelia]CAK79931.1 unnamed protein product [Paramecium tetraurelia]|eukprot:XP_001447328.1 hypothetical protein (macronuclear) [Paramecium tetraurelia strain d4-2]
MDSSEVISNPICPNKPKIPYEVTKTFCPRQENSSYLNWQEQANDKSNSELTQLYGMSAYQVLTGENQFDGHCCNKMAEIARNNQKQLQGQLATMQQLNILITEHQKLLDRSYQQLKDEKQRKEQQLAKSLDISQDLLNKDQVINQWKTKYEKETMQNQQRDHKIEQLKQKIAEAEERQEQSVAIVGLQDEINTWKNRYLNLNKTFDETKHKLNELQTESENLKSKQPNQDESSQSTTTTTTTVKRTKKQQE